MITHIDESIALARPLMWYMVDVGPKTKTTFAGKLIFRRLVTPSKTCLKCLEARLCLHQTSITMPALAARAFHGVLFTHSQSAYHIPSSPKDKGDLSSTDVSYLEKLIITCPDSEVSHL